MCTRCMLVDKAQINDMHNYCLVKANVHTEIHTNLHETFCFITTDGTESVYCSEPL